MEGSVTSLEQQLEKFEEKRFVLNLKWENLNGKLMEVEDINSDLFEKLAISSYSISQELRKLELEIIRTRVCMLEEEDYSSKHK